jgi:hypothetical protein
MRVQLSVVRCDAYRAKLSQFDDTTERVIAQTRMNGKYYNLRVHTGMAGEQRPAVRWRGAPMDHTYFRS